MIDWELVWFWIICAICVTIVIFAGVKGAKEQREWETFSKAHNCKVTERMSGSHGVGVGPTIGGNGGVTVVSTYISGKEKWVCDDGMAYWRDER